MENYHLIGLLGGFLLLALVYYLFWRHRKASQKHLSISEMLKNADQWGEPQKNCTGCGKNGCCGGHSHVQHKQQKKQPTYYDDEELDRYIGRPATSYSTEEIAAFQEVYDTLLAEDREGWLASIRERGIELPKALIL